MERRQPTLADYMVIAISPALIMAMIGSLVFFLIHAMYRAQFEARLCYVAALFVFAAVLVARIAIEEGRSYASIFSLFLALAVWLVMKRFTTIWFPLDVGMIALVLWSADRLTWDCTLIDESDDPSNQGLLQTVGFGGDESGSSDRSESETETTSRPGLAANGDGLVVAAMNDPEAALRDAKEKAKDWWSRRQRRPNKPGVWVIYFSLAAIPLFGLGQWFVPANSGSRWYTFILLAIYLASGFGLLVTTSFLGLRLYLRRRDLEMPTSMAGVWLGAGAAKIVVMLIIISMATMLVWMLPRQRVESQISGFFSAPENIQPNRYGFGNDGPQDKDATRTGKQPEQQQSYNQEENKSGQPKQDPAKGNGGSQNKSSSEQQDKGNSEKKENGSKSQQHSDKGENDKSQGGNKSQKSDKNESNGGSKQQSGNKSESQGGGKQQSSGSKEQGGGKKQQSGSKSEQQKKQQDSGSKQSENKEQNKNSESKQSNEPKQQNEESKQSQGNEKGQTSEQQEKYNDSKQNQQRKQANQQSQQKEQAASQRSESSPPPSNQPSQWLSNLTSWMGSLAKLVFYLVILIVLAAFLWFFRNEIRTAWARLLATLQSLWLLLFGRQRGIPPPAEPTIQETGPPPKPFSSFENPFTSGLANRCSADELVNYSFEALEAWAREHQCTRHPDQTPHEFAYQVGTKENAIGPASRTLADLYCRAAYAPGTLPPTCVQQLQIFWQRLQQTGAFAGAALS